MLLKAAINEVEGEFELLSWDDPRTDYYKLIIDEETGRYKFISWGEYDVFAGVVYYKRKPKVNFRQTLKNYEKAWKEWYKTYSERYANCQCEDCRRRRGEID